MAKKKKSQAASEAAAQTNGAQPAQAKTPTPTPTPPPSISNPTSTPKEPPNPWFGSKGKNGEPSTSALIICRNKHWRYISSFHGPWLQLPPEVLESLAHTNYISPRPHPIDPAVFFDLVKIRKAVDEATNIAVRAASGVTSASLNASNNSLLNNAAASSLGLGFSSSGAKLSRERKHRMRELATQKLAQAYRLDEIAASVATMQSASTLEDLASHVLQRNAADWEARYVHFFHEKIPSRMMAEYTPLEPLNALLSERPSDGSAFRTRALTRIFKEDYAAAARDLSEGLAVARWMASQHRAGNDQLVLASEAAKQQQRERAANGKVDWRNEIKVEEQDQPSSLEAQMLFHRGNVHLALACQHVHDALDAFCDEQDAKGQQQTENGHTESATSGADTPTEEAPRSATEKKAHKRHLEMRKLVKSNARKALKDYLEFLKHFDYTPGIPAELAEEFVRRLSAAQPSETRTHTRNVNGAKITTQKTTIDFPEPLDAETGALIPAAKRTTSTQNGDFPYGTWPPAPEIYPASQLFSEKVPVSIPAYPPLTSNALAVRSGPTPEQLNSSSAAAAGLADSNESVTYHPLLTDALHSLLLCHALLQTSPTELKRHAHNAARLARICDGYPIFLAARSPARADWVEVLRRANNWINLTQSWEALCRPAPLPGHGTQSRGDRGWNIGREDERAASNTINKKAPTPAREDAVKQKQESEKNRQEMRKHEAILEALADDRVVDEESFQRAVRAREKRAIEDEVMAEKAAADAKTLPFTTSPIIKEIEDMPIAGTGDDAFPTPTATPTEDKKPSTNGTSSPKRSSSSPRKPNSTTNGTQHKRWAQDEGKDYPISTERSEAISRWVREAPLTVEGAAKGKKSGAAKKKKTTGPAGLVKELSSLSVGTSVGDEEEVD